METKIIQLINTSNNNEGIYSTDNLENIPERVLLAEKAYIKEEKQIGESDLEDKLLLQGFNRVYIDEEINLTYF